MRLIALVVTVLILASCSHAAPQRPPLVGGDLDAHGCRPSAGYQWCRRTTQCERPWELARRKNFQNTATAFRKFCDD